MFQQSPPQQRLLIQPQVYSPQNNFGQKVISQQSVITPQKFIQQSPIIKQSPLISQVQRSPVAPLPPFRPSPNSNSMQNLPVMLTQSNVHPAQMFSTPPQIVERIEQPLQVVDLYQVEEPWRNKVQQLENEIAALRGQPRPVQQQVHQQNHQPAPIAETVYIRDDDKIEELERDLSQAYAQIQQFLNTISIFQVLQEDNQKQCDQIDERKMKIVQIQEDLALKSQEFEEALDTIDDLNNQINDQTNTTEQKHTYLISEVNTWKQKFVELNKDFHNKQELFMLTQAELDNLKHTTAAKDNTKSKRDSETKRSSQYKS